MDSRLLAWGYAARRRGSRIPPLWLFTDARRLPDPLSAVSRLPRGLAGVVFRHDGDPDRAALGQQVAQICRSRRLALVVAGDVRLAATLRAGVHLRSGRWAGLARRRTGLVTSSAHGLVDLRRAWLAGADVAFLSPALPTASHPGAAGLGILRWIRLAGAASLPVGALGGIDGVTVRRLPRRVCRSIGAIGALA